MAKYIPLDILVAEIERRKKYYENLQMIKPVYESNIEDLNELLSFLDTLEVREVDNTPNIRFPHYKSIVEKVFGASNLESFEYDEAEQLVSLAKEELLKDLEVKEINSKDDLIEKVCNLLSRMVWEVTYEDLEGDSVEHYDKTEFIEEIRKYMKGD